MDAGGPCWCCRACFAVVASTLFKLQVREARFLLHACAPAALPFADTHTGVDLERSIRAAATVWDILGAGALIGGGDDPDTADDATAPGALLGEGPGLRGPAERLRLERLASGQTE